MIFEPDFKPIQRENGFIKTLPREDFFKVLYVEPLVELPPRDFGSVNANTNLADQEYTQLYMNDGELGQYRLIPIDDIVITVNQPRAQVRFANRNVTGRITRFQEPPLWSKRYNLAELFVFEDDKVFVSINNPTNYVQQKTRVQPIGFRYVLEPAQRQTQYVAVPTEGWRVTRT